MQKLQINRDKWNRGQTPGKLFNPETEKYCILGFFGKEFFDLTNRELDEETYLSTVLYKINLDGKQESIGKRIIEFKEKFCPTPFEEVGLLPKIWSINDDPQLDQKKRESQLRDLFRRHFNIELEFIG